MRDGEGDLESVDDAAFDEVEQQKRIVGRRQEQMALVEHDRRRDLELELNLVQELERRRVPHRHNARLALPLSGDDVDIVNGDELEAQLAALSTLEDGDLLKTGHVPDLGDLLVKRSRDHPVSTHAEVQHAVPAAVHLADAAHVVAVDVLEDFEALLSDGGDKAARVQGDDHPDLGVSVLLAEEARARGDAPDTEEARGVARGERVWAEDGEAVDGVLVGGEACAEGTRGGVVDAEGAIAE